MLQCQTCGRMGDTEDFEKQRKKKVYTHKCECGSLDVIVVMHIPEEVDYIKDNFAKLENMWANVNWTIPITTNANVQNVTFTNDNMDYMITED